MKIDDVEPCIPCPECGGGGAFGDWDTLAVRSCERCKGTGVVGRFVRSGEPATLVVLRMIVAMGQTG